MSKTCKRCNREKPFAAFSRRSRSTDGYQPWCKECSHSHKATWISNNRDKIRWSTLWTKYRVRPEQYEAMLEKQDHRCALCRSGFTTTPQVDHDHFCCPGNKSCGICVRGLVCQRCNLLLGMLENNAHLLRHAIIYANALSLFIEPVEIPGDEVEV